MSTDIAPYTAAVNNLAVWSSLDVQSDDGKRVLFNAISDSTPLRDAVDPTTNRFVVDMVNVIIHPTDRTDDDGEVSKTARLVIIDSYGNAYSTMSTNIINQLMVLFSVFGTPDTWNEPISVIFSERKSRSGRYFLHMAV